jgi:hypothetical protein
MLRAAALVRRLREDREALLNICRAPPATRILHPMSVRSTKLTRHTRVAGEARAALARAWSTQYHTGKTIREIADANDRSYGFVRNVILESGAQLRMRGSSKLNPSQRRST